MVKMTKKLKTLKDYIDDCGELFNTWECKDIPEELRDIAREWIEHLTDYRWGFKNNQFNELTNEQKKLLDDDFYCIDVVIRWIKYFFEIDDEDDKEM